MYVEGQWANNNHGISEQGRGGDGDFPIKHQDIIEFY